MVPVRFDFRVWLTALGVILGIALQEAPADHPRPAVVEVAATPNAETRAALERAGVRVQRAIGCGRFIALVDPGVSRPRGVLRISPLEPAEKLHALLRTGPPAWSVARDEGRDWLLASVVFRDDVPARRWRGVIESVGGRMLSSTRLVKSAVAQLPMGGARDLARRGEVLWIEPAPPKFGGHNAENRAVTGVDLLRGAPYGLTGAGVNVMVFDLGTPQVTHPDYAGRVTARDAPLLSVHAAHVTGTVAGDGTVSAGVQEGMAPGATVQSYWVNQVGVATAAVNDPGDAEADYAEAIRSFGADLANNSIGLKVAENAALSCDLEGDYGVMSALLDAVVVGSLDRPFPLIWAGGNERGDGRCGSAYSTIPPPSGAKNPIVVGAVNANDLSMTDFSSWGPTDDGRLKPDLCAPGCQQGGDGGVTSTWINSDYGVLCGTSMSAPTVTGIGALVLEEWRAIFPDRPSIRPSLLKALLVHTAQEIESPGPDYRSGWGVVNALAAVDQLRTGSFVESSVDDTDVHTAFVNVAPGEPELRITLAWDDPPGMPGFSPSLVNDLDLAVFDPMDARHFPQTLDPMNPGAAATATTEDRLNNVEQVRVADPVSGMWRIEVRGFSVPEGPQPFALVSSPDISALSVTIEDGPRQFITPNTPAEVMVRIRPSGETIVPGSERLTYRIDAGPWVDTALSPVSGDVYAGVLPPVECDESIEFYARAGGATVGEVSDPPGGDATPVIPTTGSRVIVFDDDFESDKGWTIGAPGDTASSGVWERVNPNGTEEQPEDDHTPGVGVTCFVTGQGSIGGPIGEEDVDSGATTLTSPAFDLVGAVEPRISYWLWYSNTGGANPNADVLRVEISDDDGDSWTALDTLGPVGSRTHGGWFEYSFNPADVVSLTDAVRIRFIAEDAPGGSIVEAAVDDVLIDRFTCSDSPKECPGDADGNGAVNSGDIGFVIFRLGDSGAPGAVEGDVDGDGLVSSSDISFVIFRLGTPCP